MPDNGSESNLPDSPVRLGDGCACTIGHDGSTFLQVCAAHAHWDGREPGDVVNGHVWAAIDPPKCPEWCDSDRANGIHLSDCPARRGGPVRKSPLDSSEPSVETREGVAWVREDVYMRLSDAHDHLERERDALRGSYRQVCEGREAFKAERDALRAHLLDVLNAFDQSTAKRLREARRDARALVGWDGMNSHD